ncbi:MAG: nitroreductase [Erysipelotrichaceae bacterium]|nr:nitroreductase [Erysipelotrichaceae bacterium]
MDAEKAVLTRRSTRKFQDRSIEEAVLEKIVEAGRYAPSGGNSQTNHFFVITDRKMLKQLADTAQEAFSRMETYEGMYRSLQTSINLSKTGNYVFYYNAPCLIVVANKKDYGNNMADVACAMENIMIMANANDVGSCYINQLKWLNENEEILKLFQSMGLQPDERIYGSVALGYADTEDGLPVRTQVDRKGNEVTYIR